VLDLELTVRFLDYGTDVLTGRLDPTAVASEWYIRSRRSSTDSTLRVAVQAQAFHDMVAPLRSSSTWSAIAGFPRSSGPGTSM
jgi:hypothetical protein